MKEFKSWFYYYRNGRREPIITVCLLKDKDNQIARGISICNPVEFPVRKKGRREAYNNARRALGIKQTSLRIKREEAKFTIANVNETGDKVDIFSFDPSGFCIGGYKSYFNPELSKFENRLVSKESK